MELQGISITVSDIKKSTEFYEKVLGFEKDVYYAPTKWQAFKFETQGFFALSKEKGYKRQGHEDEVDFFCKDVENYWKNVKDKVEVLSPLQITDWGSYKFVINDPDGFHLGFVQKK